MRLATVSLLFILASHANNNSKYISGEAAKNLFFAKIFSKDLKLFSHPLSNVDII